MTKKHDGWAVKDGRGRWVLCGGDIMIGRTKKAAIASALWSCYPDPGEQATYWRWLQEQGYRCVKVRIVECE